MTVGRYVLGVVAAVCVIGGAGAGAVALRRILVPGVDGALGRLVDAVLAVTLTVLTLELLGTVGLLALTPVVLASVAVGLGLRALATRDALRHPRMRGPVGDATLRRRTPDLLAVVVAVAASGVVLVEWSQLTLQSLHQGMLGFDSLYYHMPWAAQFAQSGHITAIHQTDFDYLTGFFPATSELINALAIVLMGNDVLAPVLNLGWLGLALLAGWCIGSPRGLGPATALGVAIAMATPSMFFSVPGSADTDAMGVFCVLATMALWLNLAPRLGGDRSRGALALVPAAAAAGLAVSTKLTVVAPALAITAAALAAGPAGCRRRVAGVWLPTMMITGGFWYLRNLIAVGNPLPFVSFGLLPVPNPGPLQAPNDYAIWDYVRHWSVVWGFFQRALQSNLGPWWRELIAVAVLGAGLCVVRGPGRYVRLAGLVALVTLVGYIFTPGGAGGPYGHPFAFGWEVRYIIPGLSVALAVAPLARPFAGRWGRWPWLAAMTALLASVLLEPRLWGPGYDLAAGIATGAGALLVGVVLVTAPSRFRAGSSVARVAAAAAALCLATAGLAFAYGGERAYLRGRYRNQRGLPPVTMMWRWADGLRHQRVAMVGTFGWFFGYPVFGPDISNTVVYLGQHGSHGAFTPFRTCRAFRQAVNQGHFAYLITTGRRDVWRRTIVHSPEQDWTRDPAARRVLPAHRAGQIEVWRLRGRLNVAGCPPAL